MDAREEDEVVRVGVDVNDGEVFDNGVIVVVARVGKWRGLVLGEIGETRNVGERVALF